MSDWLVGQFRNSYRTGPPRSLCTQKDCSSCPITAAVSTHGLRRKLLNSASCPSQEQWGRCAAQDGWRSRTSAGDPTGKPISAQACLRACCVSAMMPLVITTLARASPCQYPMVATRPVAVILRRTVAKSERDHVPFPHAAPDHLIVDRQGTAEAVGAVLLRIQTAPRPWAQGAQGTCGVLRVGISCGSYGSNKFTQFISARAAVCPCWGIKHNS
ncbi:hypothetical protein ASPBRDRAFT_402198 [Aspergillus brasiliensis CBS 101740]|uniref:Uncharacterized protein n=1 Tax=Aspergillus brasiliensis (strain CBS 101740 / IMI 381727 / IBT 21946) TaxID=767769 RepID=A0A1L9UX42_ASPBC|nr:hypothetical protein ASPBRDRAFT_402198 [Aspergillus brasiliensis CBS 101740]